MARKADIKDIAAIKAIADIAFRDAYREILTPEQMEYMMEMMYSETSLREQMTNQGNTFLIEDNKGYVSYRYDRTLPNGEKVFHLEKLYVLPEYHGTGIGRKLFTEAVDNMRTLGARSVELNVNRSNHALSFYQHMGMKIQRSGDFPIGEGYYMNDYIMELPLV